MATTDPMAPSRSSSPLLATNHHHFTSESSKQNRKSSVTAAAGHKKKKLAGQKRQLTRTIGIQTETHGHNHPHAKILKGSTANRYSLKTDIFHDSRTCMFKVTLDSKGTLAALCYLPTRLQSLVEFYHTEIPLHYRQMGLGDLLAHHAFQWAEQMGLLVIPTCTFVKRYLQHHDQHRDLIVRNEQEGIARLAAFTHHSVVAGTTETAQVVASSSSSSSSLS